MKIKKVNEMNDEMNDEMYDKLYYYVEVLKLFINITKDNEIITIIKKYMEDGDNYGGLTDYIGMNLKEECEWMTTLGIVESMELIVKESIENGNIKIK